MDEPVLELCQVRQALNRVRGMPFRWSLNPYRGCAHACVYCYARPTHAHLGFDDPARFDRHILVKENLVSRLRQELSRPGWRRECVAIGTATDPYQPAEARFGLTRAVLEVMLEFRNPVTVTTKSPLVTRDADLLAELGRVAGSTVYVSVATLDEDVWRATEPHAPHPRRRLEAVARLAAAGVRAGVLMAPILPGLSDRPDLLAELVSAAAAAGAAFVHPIVLRLPPGVREWCLERLAETHPRVARAYARHYPTGGGNPPADYVRRLQRRVDALCRAAGIGAERRRGPQDVSPSADAAVG